MTAPSHPELPKNLFTFRSGYRMFVIMEAGHGIMFNTELPVDSLFYQYNFIYRWDPTSNTLSLKGQPYWLDHEVEQLINAKYHEYLAGMSVGVDPGE